MTDPLALALEERGYTTLTPVQEAVTASEFAGGDLLVSAQTGSGKTVGFGLAIGPTLLDGNDRLDRAGAPLALVIAPTRELALQVKRELEWLYAHAGARLATCVGGMDARDERRALERGAHIVVATPGRLRDHIERGAIDLTDIRAVVLDEADEMLDLGFREDLEFILGQAPEERRTLMFSATVSKSIEAISNRYLRDPQRVSTMGGAKQHADIEYKALVVAPHDVEKAVINLLRFQDAKNSIVFCNTRNMVSHLTARLANRGFSVVALSGELTQTERSHALQAMRDGRARVCIATDVAARGIDLPGLELVIHADLPQNTEALLHRSGRTGRAGSKGVSALIVPNKARRKAENLLKWAKITADWTVPPSADEINAADEERLLSSDVFSGEADSTEAEFATKMLARHSAEAIAVAYLRQFRAGRSAPEDLLPPDAQAPKKQAADFGPSKWFSLSVGREDRAEARWLLPLLCRAGNLDKTDIGAIRIRDGQSFVEIAESAVKGFLSSVGDKMQLEDGITIAPSDAPEERPRKTGGFGKSERPERAPREDRGPRLERAPRAERAPRDETAFEPKPRKEYTPREDRPAREERPRFEKPAARPAPSESFEDGAPAEREKKPRHSKLRAEGKMPAKSFAKPASSKTFFRAGDKPREDGFGDRPRSDKPRSDKPRGDKPYGDRPRGDKPKGDWGKGERKFDKPRGERGSDAPRGGKPFGKPSGKFGGKPDGASPHRKGGKPNGPAREGGFKARQPQGSDARPRRKP